MTTRFKMTAAQMRYLTLNLNAESEIVFTLDNGIRLELVEQQVIHDIEDVPDSKPIIHLPTLVFSFRPIIDKEEQQQQQQQQQHVDPSPPSPIPSLNGKPRTPSPEKPKRPEKPAGRYNKKGSGW